MLAALALLTLSKSLGTRPFPTSRVELCLESAVDVSWWTPPVAPDDLDDPLVCLFVLVRLFAEAVETSEAPPPLWMPRPMASSPVPFKSKNNMLEIYTCFKIRLWFLMPYSGHAALWIWICRCSLFYRRELWASKSVGANSTYSLKICGGQKVIFQRYTDSCTR